MKLQKLAPFCLCVLLGIALGCLCGCSVVSDNRVFPKLAWYWSADAKQQRVDHQFLKELAKTNSVLGIDKK